MATAGRTFKILRGFQSNYSKARKATACFVGKPQYYHSLFNRKQINVTVTSFNFVQSFQSPVRAMGALSPLDPSSYSLPDLAKIKHVTLKLNVDFEKKVLHGSATLDFDVLKTVNEILLDVKEQTIESVQLADGSPLTYTVDSNVPNYGAKLNIKLPQAYTPENLLKIKIEYRTAPSATALQWLEPSQTSGKKHPYLFSQCQPIHARSILPCQDTPAVKFTYDAEVTAPADYTVLMSALRSEPTGNLTAFRQPVPIPSYLLALAVGVLENRRLGPRSLVWSEKEEVERSAWEFADTEKYLQAAEKLCGTYEWGQYDLLVLPPSFPYGGMENPCLTFVTPTLLAGDRSQADVIVHEIMHSWTGNLVTNRNFEHFWLNEGFTVFLERKVAASLIADKEEARRSRDFHSLLGLQELRETVVTFLGQDSPLTQLVPNLTSTHPDDSFSRVPYEKGSLFLRYLEDLVGGAEVFDDFLRHYLSTYRRQSLDTEQFRATFLEYFRDNPRTRTVQWDQWLHAPGMPPTIPDYDTSMTKAITDLVPAITTGDTVPDYVYAAAANFTPHQTINLLQDLIDAKPLPVAKLRTFGERLNLTTSHNSEIQYRWLRMCVRSRDESKLDNVFAFVNNQGRMKYVRPIYRDLYDWVAVREKAVENFLKNEKYMMTVSAYTLRKDLHLRTNKEEVAA